MSRKPFAVHGLHSGVCECPRAWQALRAGEGDEHSRGSGRDRAGRSPGRQLLLPHRRRSSLLVLLIFALVLLLLLAKLLYEAPDLCRHRRPHFPRAAGVRFGRGAGRAGRRSQRVCCCGHRLGGGGGGGGGGSGGSLQPGESVLQAVEPIAELVRSRGG